MKKSKIMAIICLTALLVNITACSGGKTTGGEVNPGSSKPEEKVTYEILKSASIPEYPTDGGVAKKLVLEKAAAAGITNFDFNVTLVGSQYTDKLNMLAASSQLPDYFSIDLTTMARFADQDLIQKLDDYLKLMPNASKGMKQSDLDTIKYKGNLYAFPVSYRPEGFNGPNVNGFVIRQDWLDKLGLKKPATIDEFYTVSKAFKENDPDGNGKADTFAIGVAKGSKFDGVFGAYGVLPWFWVEKDGGLKWGASQPEVKEALATLQKWYKEGLIDPDSIIQEGKAAEQKFVNSKYGIYGGQAFTVNPINPDHAPLLKLVPTAKVAMVESLKGPTGKQGWSESAPGYGNMHAMSKNIKNPERFAKFLDWIADDSDKGGFNLITYGIEGEHYTYDKAKNAIIQKVDYTTLYKNGFSNPIRFLQIVDRRWMVPEALAAAEITNKYIISNKYWGTVQAANDYPDLPKLLDEYFYKIITGALPIDAWDEYVKKYYAQGGKQIEDQVNAEWKKLKK
jgi:putative aldouronate transport system substrate-binding protein